MNEHDHALAHYFESLAKRGVAENRLSAIHAENRRRTRNFSTFVGSLLGAVMAVSMVLHATAQPTTDGLSARGYLAIEISSTSFDLATKRELFDLFDLRTWRV